MANMIQNNFRVRKNFGKLRRIVEVPNLIDIQKRSYDKFLQRDIPHEERDDIGLQAVFKSVFPIRDFGETSSLDFVSYSLDRPKYDADECRARGHDLRRADQGDRAAGCLGHRRRDQRSVDP
jgi:DNA-directed RNA polymerase subunit beta